MTVGPALGGLLITGGGYRLAIVVAVLIAGIAPIATLLLVPADLVRTRGVKAAPLERLRPTAQLWLILLIQMVLFSINYVLAIVSPVVLTALAPGRATAMTGVAFAFSGLASAVGILLLSVRMFRPGRLGLGLVACCAGGGLSLFLLAASASVTVYIVGFSLVSLLMAAMMPTVNSLTALNVPATRRGTAFGLVTSAQAAAFIIGPTAAALFAATSFPAGFFGVGVVFLALAALIWRHLREPAG
jgi:MFS family permease